MTQKISEQKSPLYIDYFTLEYSEVPWNISVEHCNELIFNTSDSLICSIWRRDASIDEVNAYLQTEVS